MTPDLRPTDQGAARPLRYVAIGDSLTEGVGDDPWPDGTPRGWVDRLAEILAHHHGAIDYANLAVRGYRTAQIRDTQLEAALAMEPDVVTFTAGMNDLLRPRFDREALLQALIDIVAPCTERGARVLVVPIPDIRSVLPVSRVFESRRRELNGMYRYLAEHHGMLEPTVTTGSIFEDRRAWADDRLHLSALGHERLALGAADLLGVPSDTDWLTPPDGPAPPHTLRGHVTWARTFAGPWIGRRLRGRSSGDGRVAKQVELHRLTA